MAVGEVKTDFNIEIRFFNNRFSWKWQKFTEDKWVVARILQVTRENLGYSGTSRFPEVQFENMDQSGEWYLDTKLFQQCHDLTSKEANERLKDAFIGACQEVGEEIEVMFSFEVYDMITRSVVEKINYDSYE